MLSLHRPLGLLPTRAVRLSMGIGIRSQLRLDFGEGYVVMALAEAIHPWVASLTLPPS
jgi:hypothetical protein